MSEYNFFTVLEALGITRKKILNIAYETGLIQRKRLIGPDDLLFAICNGTIRGDTSYNDIAMRIDDSTNKSVSRQAVAKKIKYQCKLFMFEIIRIIIEDKLEKDEYIIISKTLKYKRIIVQDSTIIKLPLALFAMFSGVKNQHSSVANARIQVAYDLLSGEFISFSIDTYTKNDLKSAPELQIMAGDLVLRDRGYLLFSEIERHIVLGADCIYRYKFGMIPLDVKTMKPLNLSKMLKKNGNLDIEIRLNNKEKTIVRLVSSPIDKKSVDERIRKTKKCHRNKLSKDYLEQLNYAIYLVTIPKSKVDFNMIFKLYSLRWRIEIIFKSWKSNLNFSKFNNVSHIQLFVIILSRLLMVLLFTQFFFKECKIIIYKHFRKHLSLMKTIKYLVKFSDILIGLNIELKGYNPQNIGLNIMKLKRYCCYDSRTKIMNFEQQMINILD